MTDAERKQREESLENNPAICPVCGGSIYQYGTPQYAHKLADTITNHKKYGSFVMNHHLVGVYTCSLECNHLVQINNDKGKILQLLADIVLDEMRKFNGI